jgi:predicted Rossmann fold flavoprotein
MIGWPGAGRNGGGCARVTGEFDVIILGAGAAGLMCGLAAGQRGRRVLLLEHAAEAGRKILISGGGRCNFTHLEPSADRFVSGNPQFCRAALARYTPQDFLGLVSRHGIAWHEKTPGQLFCDGSAREILRMLLDECAAGGVDLRLGHRVTGVTRGERFRVETDHGAFGAAALVLATGGLSIPKMGASGLAYDLARQFGLAVTPTRAGLVPLTFAGTELEMMAPLAGVSLPARVAVGGRAFEDAILFTHRGLSGPAILQISSYWRDRMPLRLDLLPGLDAAALLIARKQARPNAGLRSVLAEWLPQRLAVALAARFGEAPMHAHRDRALAEIAAGLKAWTLVPAGNEGYAKAEVTLGGIDTACLSQRTLEAKAVPGLFAIGEAVDVTGWLGGYNFQWAWSSGWCAGQAV